MDYNDSVLGNAYALAREKRPEFIFRYRVRAQVVANAARRFLGSCSQFKILDLGTAEGKALLELRGLLPGGEYTGVERSEELIRIKAELPLDTRIIKGNVTNLPAEIRAKQYNIVSAMALLGHLAEPQKAVSEASNVLCPGGIFVATYPLPCWEDIATRTGLLIEKPHLSKVRKRVLIDMLQKAGLEVLSYERFMWAPSASLPYLKIQLTPGIALKIDELVRSTKIFNWLFVNQCIVGRKPL